MPVPDPIAPLIAPNGSAESSDTHEALAVTLGEAIDCFRRTCGSNDERERLLHQVSEAWMLSDDRSSSLSFASICDALRVDPAQVRRMLAAWKSRRLDRTAG